MARPLREQFALATLLLLIPVIGVIMWAGRSTYDEQVRLIRQESVQTAEAIAAYLYATRSDRNRSSRLSTGFNRRKDRNRDPLRVAHDRQQADDDDPVQSGGRGRSCDFQWPRSAYAIGRLSRTVPIYWRRSGFGARDLDRAGSFPGLSAGGFAAAFPAGCGRVGRGDLQTPPLSRAARVRARRHRPGWSTTCAKS